MDRLKKGKITKKIICIVVALMLCNFIIPNYSYASVGEAIIEFAIDIFWADGLLVKPLCQLCCSVPDAVINFLQKKLVSEDGIRPGFTDNDEYDEYMILYSPATIFAGRIPAFDINFINPGDSRFSSKIGSRVVLGIGDNKEEVVEQSVSGVMRMLDYDTGISNTETLTKPLEEIKSYVYNKDSWDPDNYKDITIANDKYSLYCSKDASTARLIWYFDKYNSEDGWKSTEYCEYDGEPNDQSYVYNEIKSYLEEKYGEVPDGYNEDKENVKNQLQSTIDSLSTNDVTDGDEKKITLKNGDKEATIYIGFAGQQVNSLPKYHISYFEVENNEYDENKEYKSSAKILQTTVATWYNALRRIALVGLLSVLLYIGIRIVMTSTSAQDKAKYKGMLKDWVVALCLLFTLHYIMSITITVVDKINDVVGASAIGEDGQDVLMSEIRNQIYDVTEWTDAVVYTVMYFVLGIYTVIYTIQYFRRTVYLAFLTMIAPLITLTYPLDKIKDNKSQAFDMWLKDYVFFVLIQVVHLLLYYILVLASMDLTDQGSWIYAIVAIGFLTKAEKIVKKMFGFEKSKSMGALAAGATGAIVMNLINKGPGKPPKGGKNSSSGGSTKGVRTATNKDVMSTVRNGGTTPQRQQGQTQTGQTQVAQAQTAQTQMAQNQTGQTEKPKRDIKGIAKDAWNSTGAKGSRALLKKYHRKVFGTAIGIGTGATGAMLGFAAGVSQGDLGAALGGAVAGGKSGFNLGGRAYNGVANTAGNIRTGIGNIGDTWNEGAYGQEYANNIRFDREFRRSNDYKELRKKYADSSDSNSKEMLDNNVQQMLEAGITEKSAMDKILKNVTGGNGYSMEDAMGYYALTKQCKDAGVYYDDKKLRQWLKDNNFGEINDLTSIRDHMKNF